MPNSLRALVAPLTRSVALALCCALGGPLAMSAERAVRSKVVRPLQVPVDLASLSLRLAETYATPTQLSPPDGANEQNRIRYANRAGLQKSRLLLKGEVECKNTTRTPVEAISLAVTALDAFGAPMPFDGAPTGTSEQQIVTAIPSRGTKRLVWEQPMRQEGIYEIAVSAARVRFADGTVWTAPVTSEAATPTDAPPGAAATPSDSK